MNDGYRGSFPALDVERVSEPMRIGKHEWRLVAYWRHGIDFGDDGPVEVERRLVGYEWRPAGDTAFDPDWRRDTEWPRYNPDNGATAGLPASLRKLWGRCPWAHGRKVRRTGGAALAE